MLLFLTAIDKHQVKRQFSCQFPDLETGFEFLNQIVAKGHKLIRADLVDEKQTTSLPLEAFDGVSFLPALNQLKLEWTAILAEPVQLSTGPDLQEIRWYREQLACYEQRIIQLELMITDMNRLYQRAEATLKPCRETSNNPYHSVLVRYEAQLQQTHLLRKGMLEHL